MSFRFLGLILLCGMIVSCGPASDVVDDVPSPIPEKSEPHSPPAPPTRAERAEREKARKSKAEKDQKDNSVEPTVPVEPTRPAASVETEKPSPLLTTGQLETEIPEYFVPDNVRETIAKFQPDYLPPKASEFKIANQHLHIDAKNKTVSFRGVLQVKDKKDEAFELACRIDTSEVPWVCRDMFPTDQKLAAEKRFQGTFKCLDAYVCESVGVAIWVAIDGKLQDPKIFQANGFQLRQATSGDEDEEELPNLPPEKLAPKDQDRIPMDPNGKAEKAKKAPEEAQKPAPPLPRPRPVIMVPSQPVAKELDPQQIEQLLKQPDTALEYPEPMTLPQPAAGKFSVPGIEKLRADTGSGVRVQAVGLHTHGTLQKAAEFPAAGSGFVSRDHGKKDYATDMTVSLLTGAFAAVEKKFPGRPPVVLGSVSNPTGGRLLNLRGREHISHQTGLDADVGFPSTQRTAEFFSACGSKGCAPGRPLDAQFDIERFWLFTKQLACAENSPVIAMFLDRGIKHQLCRYVKETAHENMADACVVRALQVLYHQEGHDNHVHVRFRCPERSACQNVLVTLANGSGC